MTNRMGPESGGVTVRPTPATPSGSDTWFTDCVGNDPTTGTKFEQGFFNGLLAKFRDLFTAANPSLVVNDSMLTTAINNIIQGGAQSYAADSGTADALVVTLTPAPAGLTNGMRVWFTKSAADNATTTPTLNLNALGAKTIQDRYGNALAAKDLPASAAICVQYFSSPDKWRVQSIVMADLAKIAPYTSRVAYFFTSGSWPVPAGVTTAEVEVIGGGGGGGASNNSTAGGTIIGNCGGGGGGGAYARKKVTGLTPGGSQTVTVGAGGTAAINSAGGNGGASSFGAFCTANGGGGGAFGNQTISTVGSGGSASGGDINIGGGTGGSSGTNDAGTPTESYILNIFNKGGMAGGGLSAQTLGGTGTAGLGFGTGGTGASGGSGLAGGVGAPGLVIVRW